VNSRLDELQAAILSVRLPHLDAENERRRTIARAYVERLAGAPVVLPRAREGADHAYHLFVLRSDRRDALKDGLAARGVMAGIHYPRPAHRHPGYDRVCRLDGGALPVTEALAASVLSLPLYPELAAAELETVVQAMRQATAADSAAGAVS
jgi:dTDP-4-amino-4,6-dideoxygalactose transaminase